MYLRFFRDRREKIEDCFLRCRYVLLLGECGKRIESANFFASHHTLANLGRCHVDTAANYFLFYFEKDKTKNRNTIFCLLR